MLVVRIDTSTAAVLWMQTVDPGPGLDQAFGVTVALNGDAIVTGRFCAPATQLCDFGKIRLAAADGAVVWSQTANSGTDMMFGELGYAVVIDAHGNGDPFVSGVTCTTAISCNFRTIRRAAATGAIVWNEFRGTASYDGGLGTGIAVGGDHNPTIVGQTCNPADYSDCQPSIMKLDGATGNTIWETSGGSPEPLVLVAVAEGRDGNPVATGWVTRDGDTALRIIDYVLSEGTSEGTAVSVSLNGGSFNAGGVTVIFDTVTSGGTTTLNTDSEGPAPVGFTLTDEPAYYDIQSTAAGAASITYCLDYSDVSFTGSEDQLRLFQLQSGGGWLDVTVSQDTVAHRLCGASATLALLALGVPTP